MKKIVLTTMVLSAFSFNAMTAEQDPSVQADIDKYQDYMKKTFPEVKDFSKGAYALNEDLLSQFESIMELPPHEEYLDKGEELWNTPFANGKTFASCFDVAIEDIRPQFPRWNAEAGKVETLEGMLNKCRTDNGEKKWSYKKGNIAYVSGYLGIMAEGKTINVIVPKGDAKALAAYNEGKEFYYTKRGQLNMSCADCHVYSAGKMARGDLLSPGYGHTTHFPVWRGKWARNSSVGDGLGTLQRRYGGCNDQVRAKPFKTQGREYSNLEFFHAAMSNGLEITGTEYRR